MALDVDGIIKKELAMGEIVLWSGKPNYKKMLTKFDYFLVPFSVFWLGLAIAFAITIIIQKYYVGFVILVPILLIGCYLGFGRFIYKKEKKKGFAYAVTNRRIICAVVRRNGEIDITDEELAEVKHETLHLSRDGSGTILFGTTGFIATAFYNTGLDFLNSGATAFFDVDNAQKVFEIYKSARFTNKLMK